MVKQLVYIILCLTFVFATSGNNRGLIFKNLAKTYHSIHVDMNTPVPSAEEINEQVNEHKASYHFICIPSLCFKFKEIDHVDNQMNILVTPHHLDIPVPPPEV